MLILTIGIGEGHNKTAEAIKERVSHARIVDVLKYINPKLHKSIKHTYLNTIKYTPKLWEYSYKNSEKLIEDMGFKQLINRIAALKLRKLIEEEKPQKVICTHPFAAAFMSHLKPKYGYQLYAVVTDYTVHPMWIHKNVDKYFLPAKSVFIPKALKGQNMFFYGIPIRNEFYQKPLTKEGTTLLIAGGGLGLGKLKEVARRLTDEEHINIVVLTGKNTKLQREITDLNKTNIKAVGYTDRIIDYYDDAKIVITKPGGITSTELIMRRKPFIIFNPIPGQEEYNAEFLTKWGVAIKASKKDDLTSLVRFMLNNSFRHTQMVEAADFLARRNSKDKLVEEILKPPYYTTG